MSKLRVGVLYGGRSGEHEVSLRSARSVIDAFDPERYEIVPIGIDKQGRWLLGEASQQLLAGSESAPIAASLVATEPVAGIVPRTEFAAGSGRGVSRVTRPAGRGWHGAGTAGAGRRSLRGLRCAGLGGGHGQGRVQGALCRSRLPQVPYLVLLRKTWDADPDGVLDFVESQLAYPVFVKPANLGSSVGVSKAKDREQLLAAICEAARYDRKLVVEAGIDAREIEVSVLGNDEPVASVPGEVVPAPRVLRLRGQVHRTTIRCCLSRRR